MRRPLFLAAALVAALVPPGAAQSNRGMARSSVYVWVEVHQPGPNLTMTLRSNRYDLEARAQSGRKTARLIRTICLPRCITILASTIARWCPTTAVDLCHSFRTANRFANCCKRRVPRRGYCAPRPGGAQRRFLPSATSR